MILGVQIMFYKDLNRVDIGLHTFFRVDIYVRTFVTAIKFMY